MALAARLLSFRSIQLRDLNRTWGNLEQGSRDPNIPIELGLKAS